MEQSVECRDVLALSSSLNKMDLKSRVPPGCLTVALPSYIPIIIPKTIKTHAGLKVNEDFYSLEGGSFSLIAFSPGMASSTSGVLPRTPGPFGRAHISFASKIQTITSHSLPILETGSHARLMTF